MDDNAREIARLKEKIVELDREIKVKDEQIIELMLELGWDKPVQNGMWKG